MSDRTCRTCRFRVNASRHVCSQGDVWRQGVFPNTVRNPVTGLTHTHYPPGYGTLRPGCESMRAPGGDCGPEGHLYEPRLRTRLWRWLLVKIKGEG